MSAVDVLLIATKHLEARLRILKPSANILANGYTQNIEDNLIPGIAQEQFAAELNHGGGHELEGKFRAAHSSSALAVNSFARFKTQPDLLRLDGVSGFRRITFEKKCPTGLSGEPPNLDLVCEGDSGVVAIESKCTEYLHEKGAPDFSPAYFERIDDERRAGNWFAAMVQLARRNVIFSHLDAAQLIKHAFGLAHCFKEKSCSLLYLFWEPANAARFPVFVEHREEIAKFAELVSGSFPRFSAMSYPELWSSWASQAEARSSWLPEHLRNLHDRYLVALTSDPHAR